MTDRRCHYCGTTAPSFDLRPYGPGGAFVCFRCATSPPRQAQTEAAFSALLDANQAVSPSGVVTIGDQDGPRPFDPEKDTLRLSDRTPHYQFIGHTPGPWEWHSWGITRKDSDEPVLLTRSYRSGTYVDLSAEDADLIAAAPGLLAENQRLREALKEVAALADRGVAWSSYTRREVVDICVAALGATDG